MSKAQDPFASTSDPNLYVPRTATETALDALADTAWHGAGIAALLGPAGLGKSLLLRVLARRAEDALHCIHVPVPTLDPEGITLWAASRLPGGRRLGGSDALLEVARERPLLLLIEDAELLPEDSARAVAELHRASEGAIRAVLTVNADELPETLESGFAPGIQKVSLCDPMTRDEVVDYVTRRLAAAGVPQSVAERFDAAAIAKLHEVSEGNPARLNIAARTHMPLAARSLAPTLPDAGLWQDPFPLQSEAGGASSPASAQARTRRRWAWGISRAVAASAATFGVGLLLGLWLRGEGEPKSASLGASEAPRTTAAVAPTRVADEVPAAVAPSVTPARPTGAPASDVASLDGSALATTSPATPPLRERPRPEPIPQIEKPPPVAASPASRESTPSAPAAGLLDADRVTTVVDGEPLAATTVEVPAAEASASEVIPESDAGLGVPDDSGPTERAALARDEVPAVPRLPLFAPELPRELTTDLRLDSEPPAVVEIDGRSFGPTPIRIPGLRPGVHRLVAHFRTGETMTRELVLSSGEVEFSLRGPLRRAPRGAGESGTPQPLPGSAAAPDPTTP